MNGTRRQALLQLGALACAVPAAAAVCDDWPAWQTFKRQFIGDGGRVAESARPDLRTVSEAQGYALFFALVADDIALFERLLRWTEDQLADGDLTRRLPAWHWGRRDDGSFGVIDDNAAADADLWIAYALGQAGRLWNQRRYTAMALLLADRVLREETAVLPGLGPTLLPAPRGFALPSGRWKLNPSYLVPLQLRWFAAHLGGAWPALLESSLQLLRDSAPLGLAPDWVVYDGEGRRFLRETPTGSYDAIRVYLWLGLGGVRERTLLTHFAPMAELVERSGAVPENVQAFDGTVSGAGPAGFAAAMLPFLQALGRPAAVRRQRQRLLEAPPAADAYYSQVLALFGQGAHEGRFRFDADGSLQPAWTSCGRRSPR